MGRWLAGLVLVAAVMAAGEAGAQNLRMDRTDPDHMRGQNIPPDPPQPLPPWMIYSSSRRLYALKEGLGKHAKADPELSRLCRMGAFTQKVNGFYWATTPDRSYGVAFSEGATLVDAQNKRKPGKVYFFDKPDSRCTVYVGDQEKMKPFFLG